MTVLRRLDAVLESTKQAVSIFLNFLVPKLPAPTEGDLSKGILEAIDMDSYRRKAWAAVSQWGAPTAHPPSPDRRGRSSSDGKS